MPRFFTAPITEKEVFLDGEDALHISKSLRLKPGEEIVLCDGSGQDYRCRILSTGETVAAAVEEIVPSVTEPKLKITLFQALPKGDKLELIIQKSVELGVTEIVPVLTERCISRPDRKTMEKKLLRYNKIALEAAKQSGRGIVPQVSGLLTLPEAVKRLPKTSVVFYEKGGKRLPEIIDPAVEEVAVFVGSEGGFPEEEISFLEANGVVPATLGSRILRCETAPLCGLSVMLSLTGDI